ncbi:hypothetical protein SUGI_0227750 [Cryptomeria japonica]|uniref:patatin-like protein 6 n=1 Tax=Cryptomeria japonica TaxID=3369 RepID=UPI0024089BE3|nr:patatin-like protein 6 [Cryptomeria japonica]GLJ14192.1 hypothetical protein SUGI_0227750 [Cryptomeria japonica]
MALSESMEGDDLNNLSYKIFSKLESDWLFGLSEKKLWIPQLLQELVVENPMAAPPAPPSRGKVCVLSIDGGGTRGVIAARALAFLEDALKRKSGNPDAAVADYFDVAAGTGSGGILTTMLFASGGATGRPLFKAAHTWRLLVEEGKKMFSPSGSMARFLGTAPAYSTKKLERVFKSWFVKPDGKCLTLKDTVKPVLIPCYDLSTAAPFLFSRADALETDNYDFNLWEVCRATAATPGLFNPMSLSSVDGHTSCTALDGGLVMNNPAVAAITHVLHNKQEFPWVNGVDDLLVLSLGTGQFDQSDDPGHVNEWGKRNGNVKGKGSSASSTKPIMKILLDGLSDTADHVITTAFGDHNRQNYVRVQATGLPDKSVPEMDDASQSNMKKLLQISDKMLKEKSMESVPFGGKRLLSQTNAQRLEWFAEQLIAEHQARSTRKVPTVVLKHTYKDLHADSERTKSVL